MNRQPRTRYSPRAGPRKVRRLRRRRGSADRSDLDPARPSPAPASQSRRSCSLHPRARAGSPCPLSTPSLPGQAVQSPPHLRHPPAPSLAEERTPLWLPPSRQPWPGFPWPYQPSLGSPFQSNPCWSPIPQTLAGGRRCMPHPVPQGRPLIASGPRGTPACRRTWRPGPTRPSRTPRSTDGPGRCSLLADRLGLRQSHLRQGERGRAA
jgi:hypothetical protein